MKAVSCSLLLDTVTKVPGPWAKPLQTEPMTAAPDGLESFEQAPPKGSTGG